MKHRLGLVVYVALLLSLPAAAQISIPNTFTPNTRVLSADVNANFSALGAGALNRAGGAMTGTLTTAHVLPDSHNTRDLGSTAVRFRDAWFGRDVAATGALAVGGATTVGTTLGVTGAATLGTLAVGGGTAITSVLSNTVTWDPASLGTNASSSTTVTITGIQESTPCFVGGNLEDNGSVGLGMQASAYYQTTNTARVTITNAGNAVGNLPSMTMRVTCFLY